MGQISDPEEVITDLRARSRSELIELFSNLYDAATSKRIGNDFLIRAIAFRLQEKAYGGLNAGVRRRLHYRIDRVNVTTPH